MILKSIKILYIQNVQIKLLTDILLKNYKDYDILFIQESPWSILQHIPYAFSEEGEEIIEAPNHLL